MKFYKYYSDTDYSLDSLDQGYFWFNFPCNFNDPFDTTIDFEASGSIEEWMSFLRNNLNYNEAESLSFIENNGIIKNKKYRIPLFENNFRKTQAISCFSKSCNNILMWSHYAAKHQGFCLGFKTIKPSNFHLIKIKASNTIEALEYNKLKYLPLRKVEYRAQKPNPFNPLIDSDELLLEYTLQKALSWKYENEYRLSIAPMHYQKNKIYYCKSILTDVFIGYKTSESIISSIIDILKLSYTDNCNIKLHYPDKNSLEYQVRFLNSI